MAHPQNMFTTDPILRSIMDASPVGIVVFDHDARVLYANDLAEQLFGISADALIGTSCGDFIACHHRRSDPRGCGHTEHCPSCPFHQAIQAVLEGNADPEMTKGEALVHREADRTPLWLKFGASGVVLDGHQAVVMALDDITERRRAETQLREKTLLLQNITDHMLDMVAITDLEGVFTYAGPSHQILGFGSAQFVGTSVFDYVHPDDAEYIANEFAAFMANPTPETTRTVEYRQRCADGAYLWLETKGKFLVDDKGSPCSIFFSSRDITERVRAEQALRDGEALQRKMVANISDVIAIIDQVGIIRFKSANIEKCFGWRSEDLLGTLAWENVHPEDLEGALKMYAELLLEPNGTKTAESRYRCKDGTYKWISFAAVNLLHDPDIKGVLLNYRDITDSKRAEAALMESESRLSLALEAVSDGIWDWRVDTGKVYYSPRWYLMLGYEPYELPQEFETWQKLLHPDDRSRAEQVISKHLDTTEPFEMEFRMRTRQGEWKWILARGKTVERNVDGAAKRMLGTHVDITERKRAADAQRESERHLQKVFDILPVGLWFADKEGTLLRGNPAGKKIWGAEPLVDPSRYGIFKARRFPSGEEIAATDWALYQTIRDKATIVDELLEIDAFDGKKKIILNSTAPVLDEQGDVQGAIVVNQDITERKRVEANLKRIEWMLSKKPPSAIGRQAEAHDQGYGDLTGLNRDGAIITLIGPELLQSFANDYLDLLGTSTAIYEASGDYALGIFASGWCRMMDRASRKLCDTPDNAKALQSGQWLCHESCWTCCSKEAIAKHSPIDIACHGGIRLYGVPILAGGKVAGVINFGYGDPPKDPVRLRQLAKDYHLDYDDLIREARAYDSRPPYIIEMAKSRLHATGRLIGSILEAKLAEKARQKLQDQLNQAQKMESIGRLAGGVAHDYNNMLGVILGYTEMALEKIRPDDPLHGDLTEVYKAAQRSTDITRQLLAFARKQTIAPKIIDLNDIVESMLRMLRRLIGEDIDLTWHPGKQLWPVKMDPAQVDQILVNLCVNARDAIGGVGEVAIETANITIEDDYGQVHIDWYPGDFVMLAVSDDGSGMDKETLDNIFEPFFTTKGISEGTGLGLPTVYGIVKQNEGFVNVYSEPVKGTTFRIYLPKHAGTQSQSPLEGQPQAPKGRGEAVLLVEDEPAIMRMGAMMLKRLGYHVLTAGTPDQAIRMAAEHKDPIDLLITDVVMPEMNGRQLSEQLNQRFPGIRTLFMSGYTANVIAHRGVLDEGMHFIQKPFSARELGIMVRRVLDDH